MERLDRYKPLIIMQLLPVTDDILRLFCIPNATKAVPQLHEDSPCNHILGRICVFLPLTTRQLFPKLFQASKLGIGRLSRCEHLVPLIQIFVEPQAERCAISDKLRAEVRELCVPVQHSSELESLVIHNLNEDITRIEVEMTEVELIVVRDGSYVVKRLCNDYKLTPLFLAWVLVVLYMLIQLFLTSGLGLHEL
jgi:hypothetical protein